MGHSKHFSFPHTLATSHLLRWLTLMIPTPSRICPRVTENGNLQRLCLAGDEPLALQTPRFHRTVP